MWAKAMADYIRLNSKNTLRDVLHFLEKSEESSVYIEIPARSSLWDLKNLRLLRRAGKESEKKIVVVTGGRVDTIRAEKAGLLTVSPDKLFKGLPMVSKTEKEAASPAAWVSEKQAGRHLWLGRKKRAWIFGSSVAVAALALLLIANFVFEKASIIVYAKAAEKDYSFDTVLGQGVPAVKVSKEKTKSQIFKSTGQNNTGTKAQGTVNLLSSYPSTLTLRADTTYLESGSGKRYRFSSHVTGLRPDSPQVVNVTAEESGESGNLSSGARLEVHNSAFGYRPQVLYATVGAGITGGSNNFSVAVSDKDLEKAKEALSEEILKDVQTETGLFLLNDLSRVEIQNLSYDAKAGESRENFTATMKAQVSALGFKEEDLRALAEAETAKKLTQSENLIEVNSASFKYYVRSFDLDNNIAVVNVSYTSKLSPKLDANDLKTLFAGKNSDQIKEILVDKTDIEGVRVSLSPFWRKSTPRDTGRIDVKVELTE